MKIKIAIIPSEHIVKAQSLSVKIQEAMEAGKISVVDNTTKILLSLTDPNNSLAVSEENWQQMIKQIRAFNRNFKSDYIIEKSQLEIIISAGLDDRFTNIVTIIKRALKNRCVVLQIPYEEEDEDV
ncbi:MAG: hypothetical protein HQK52_12750 [Oligoflexia bacterium]|nr:hypothetical protein [Oligoflexia bacterium]